MEESKFKVGDRVIFTKDYGQADRLPNLGDAGTIEASDMFFDGRWHIRWDKRLDYHAIEQDLRPEDS